jgi:cob(I)alamin adenosyltransferase
MAIYTKTGDRGETSLVSYDKPIRTAKDSLRIQAIGAIDEVNSYLGMCDGKFKEIQKNLFTVGAILAKAQLRFPKEAIKELEREIDRLEGTLPVLKNFILPGGGRLGSHLFFARAIARRAERTVVTLAKKETVPDEILQYLNRLSDYLFMKAREANAKDGKINELWLLPPQKLKLKPRRK